jgi:uncharacterized protein YutE (UPF0331/DUF86 family)
MPNQEVICRKLKILSGYFTEFEQATRDLSLEEYQNENLKRRAIEREIQLIVECATDINNMILKYLCKGPAKDYFNTFIDLAELNVLKADFALKIAPSTGLRNILVHEYQEIDDETVYRSIVNIKIYYAQYIQAISNYLGC